MKMNRIPPIGWFGIAVAAITALCGTAWLQLAKDGAGKALHAYAAGIPLICAWLVWQRLPQSRGLPVRSAPIPAILLAIAALIASSAAAMGPRHGWIHTETTWLSLAISGWVLGIWAAAFAFLGVAVMRLHAFAAGFLIFTVPLPQPAVEMIEIALQHASAWAVELSFQIGGVTYFRDARSFTLPGLRFIVAQECSGIRSSLVLFITSILGGYLLLRSPWRRGLLAVAVIPLGIARNTLRIVTLALLSVHVDPTIIDSPLHHRGGPLFFAISLIPFFLLLAWLRRQERHAPRSPSADPGAVQEAPADSTLSPSTASKP
jgi:exosortase C (VPDSG-CTERM-specific)